MRPLPPRAVAAFELGLRQGGRAARYALAAVSRRGLGDDSSSFDASQVVTTLPDSTSTSFDQTQVVMDSSQPPAPTPDFSNSQVVVGFDQQGNAVTAAQVQSGSAPPVAAPPSTSSLQPGSFASALGALLGAANVGLQAGAVATGRSAPQIPRIPGVNAPVAQAQPAPAQATAWPKSTLVAIGAAIVVALLGVAWIATAPSVRANKLRKTRYYVVGGVRC